MRQIKKLMQRGLLDPEKEDPFSLFVASTNIRYCYYHDTHKILGNTFGMAVLQVQARPSLVFPALLDSCQLCADGPGSPTHAAAFWMRMQRQDDCRRVQDASWSLAA